jgi:ribose transport system ATP-binding protein/rhamnose transport system ATP-binding protein
MRKSFGSVEVVRNVSLDLLAGEVHGLIGENGAGKTTLIKMLGGVHRPDAGVIEVGGQAVELHGPADARHKGIALVHQELAVFPDLSATENVFMGRFPTGAGSLLDRSGMNAAVRAALADLGVHIDVERPMRDLSIGQQQLVEIAKGITSGSQVIVLDEPTAALTSAEVHDLFRIIRALTARGVAILFVSHRLDELFAICDRITIMRDGERVHQAPISELTPDEVIRHMVGRRLDGLYPKVAGEPGEVVLAVDGISRAGVFVDISFTLRRGEIVGFAGLVGAGRTEIARALFGIDAIDSGTIAIDGAPVPIRSTADAMARGIAYLPEDRHAQGILPDASIAWNVALASLQRIAGWFGLVSRASETEVAKRFTARLNVRMRNLEDRAGTLSGGNQQKVVLAKWLATAPRILIVDEPTRGIDVGAKAEVHRILVDLAASGVAILMISSDLPELLGMAQRILVVRNGHITQALDAKDADQERVMASATAQRAEIDRAHAGHARAHASTLAGDALRGVLRLRELSLVGVVVCLMLVMAALQPRFLALDNLQDIVRDAGILVILAVGQAIVLITRNLDLSVGAVVGTAAFAAVTAMQHWPDAGIAAGLGAAVATGAVVGIVNGALVVIGRVPSIVATLGTLYAVRGLLSLPLLAGGGNEIGSSGMAPSYLAIGSASLAGIPVMAWAAAAATIIVGLALRHLAAGRYLYATGSNADAARLIGLPVGAVMIAAFEASGVAAGIAGFLIGARFGYAGPDTGTGLELQAIAAAVIGGVGILGGSGSPVGAALGALLLGMIGNALAVLTVPGIWLQAITGLFILGAIVLQAAISAQNARAHRLPADAVPAAGGGA